MPHHLAFDDGYTASGDGLAETRHVFLQGNALSERLSAARRFAIGELGLGTGLNLAATWQLWARHAPPEAVLNYVTCELEPLRPDDMRRALSRWPELEAFAQEIARACGHLVPGYNLRILAGGRLRLLILIGDATEQLQQLAAQIDAWYLDGFSPARNPAMWSANVCEQVARVSAPDATLATFTAAGWVRRNLVDAGFAVQKTPGYGRKRDMTVGRFAGSMPKQSAHSGPITVVGAGIAGASTAAALARLGRQVSIWDDGRYAPSRLPALLVRPWPERPRHPLAAFFASAFGCAAHGLRGMPGWHPHGVALLSRDVDDDAPMSAAILKERCGTAVSRAGTWLSGAGCLEPAPWIEHLLDHANITRINASWRGPELGEPTVLATGATGKLDGLGPLADLPASLTRGQMSRLNVSETFDPVASIAGAGLCARTPAGVWVGSSFEHDKLDTDPSEKEAQAYVGKWLTLLPDLPATSSDHRAAVRVAGHGRMPYVGQLGEGIWVNWGHGSRGATAACLSAETLAAAIDGHPSPLPRAQSLKLSPQRLNKP